MRRFFALMITIALAFNGLVNAIATEPPCPMEKNTLQMHGDMAMQMDMDMDMDDHDCCNDFETYLKTGQMCKTKPLCSSAGAGLLPVIPSFSALTFRDDFLPLLQPPPLTVYPIGVWRPPTLS